MTTDTADTAALEIACCSCHVPFKQRTKDSEPWRQRSLAVPDKREILFAYLCGKCSARFSSDDAVHDYLDAELDLLLVAKLRPAC